MDDDARTGLFKATFSALVAKNGNRKWEQTMPATCEATCYQFGNLQLVAKASQEAGAAVLAGNAVVTGAAVVAESGPATS